MLLVFSYQLLNIASWTVQTCVKHTRPTSGPNGSKIGTQQVQDLKQLLLSLFYAAEFPLIASYHPMVLKDSLGGSDAVPSDYQLIGQVLVFVIVEQLMHPFFMNFYTLYSTEKPMDASGLATDFSIQQTALLVAIVFIQWPSREHGAGNLFGELHILAIAGWIMLQKMSQVSKIRFSGSMDRI